MSVAKNRRRARSLTSETDKLKPCEPAGHYVADGTGRCLRWSHRRRLATTGLIGRNAGPYLLTRLKGDFAPETTLVETSLVVRG